MMRGAAVILLLAAAAGWLGLVAPARRARDRARAEYGRLREERERLRAEIAGLTRQRPTAPLPGDAAAAGRALRLTLLGATRGLPVEAVRIAARGEKAGLLAQGSLSAEGGMAPLLRVAERLADPAASVRIDRVVLGPARGVADRTLRLDLDGVRLGAGS